MPKSYPPSQKTTGLARRAPLDNKRGEHGGKKYEVSMEIAGSTEGKNGNRGIS